MCYLQSLTSLTHGETKNENSVLAVEFSELSHTRDAGRPACWKRSTGKTRARGARGEGRCRSHGNIVINYSRLFWTIFAMWYLYALRYKLWQPTLCVVWPTACQAEFIGSNPDSHLYYRVRGACVRGARVGTAQYLSLRVEACVQQQAVFRLDDKCFGVTDYTDY